MALSPFSVTWDYRCPFARNVHEHLVAGLQAGAEWDVNFTAFSLSQVHVQEGEPDVWDDPSKRPTLLAMMAGIVVRDTRPDDFLQVHQALFAARHDQARDIRQPEVLRAILDEQGVDGADILATVEDGSVLEAFRKEHEAAASDYGVWGVPTFITQGRAAFVRIMTRPEGDGQLAIRTIERTVEAVGGWTDLNELKHTTIPR